MKEKKYREKQRRFLIEGRKLFDEAVKASLAMDTVFALPEWEAYCKDRCPDVEVVTVTPSVLEKISTEKSPEGIICVANYIDKFHNINKIYNKEDFCKTAPRVLLLSSLRDPGNLGTVIRTARAFGVEELILSADCADLYHPRTVRAAMGTLFNQVIGYTPSLAGTVEVMREAGYTVAAAVLDGKAERLDEMTVTAKTAFVIGNEGHGIDPSVVKAAGHTVYIPMAEGVESLNAAAAAAVFMWQQQCALQNHA